MIHVPSRTHPARHPRLARYHACATPPRRARVSSRDGVPLQSRRLPDQDHACQDGNSRIGLTSRPGSGSGSGSEGQCLATSSASSRSSASNRWNPPRISFRSTNGPSAIAHSSPRFRTVVAIAEGRRLKRLARKCRTAGDQLGDERVMFRPARANSPVLLFPASPACRGSSTGTSCISPCFAVKTNSSPTNRHMRIDEHTGASSISPQRLQANGPESDSSQLACELPTGNWFDFWSRAVSQHS